ncbi:hypothetical protein MMC19_005020 [Ptychographa xylographoides]|nr:hypothetical protein [Ptychographa xylographoides]
MTSQPLQIGLSASLTPLEVTNAYASFSTQLATYESRIGQATRSIATYIPALLPAFTSTSPLILDDACGTGAVTFEILQSIHNARIQAVDASSEMIGLMQAQLQLLVDSHSISEGAVSTAVMDAQALDFPPSIFDAAIMNHGLHFLPDPVLGVAEMHRVLKPGGTGIVTVWADIGFLPILWEVQRIVEPEDPVLAFPVLERWFDEGYFERTIRDGGFDSVSVKKCEASLSGQGLSGLTEVLVQNFRGLFGSQWSEEEKSKLKRVTAEVLEKKGVALGMVSTGKNGKAEVKMAAWVGVGKKRNLRDKPGRNRDLTQGSPKVDLN